MPLKAKSTTGRVWPEQVSGVCLMAMAAASGVTRSADRGCPSPQPAAAPRTDTEAGSGVPATRGRRGRKREGGKRGGERRGAGLPPPTAQSLSPGNVSKSVKKTTDWILIFLIETLLNAERKGKLANIVLFNSKHVKTNTNSRALLDCFSCMLHAASPSLCSPMGTATHGFLPSHRAGSSSHTESLASLTMDR